jgi:AcrR family transcriptional regulator
MNPLQVQSLDGDQPDAGLPSTRDALLDAAERLFAERGVEGTSVRDIIKAAGANLGAVNYHFRSKDQLAVEVFARRIAPINRKRIARLDAIEASAEGAPVTVEQVLEAIICPVLEDPSRNARHHESFARLVCRVVQEPNAELKAYYQEQFGEVIRRFDVAFLCALPGIDPENLFWGIHFVVGALNHTMDTWVGYEWLPKTPSLREPSNRRGLEGVRRQLVAFCAAGLRALAN